MKKLLIFGVLLCALHVGAQAPQGINYQAVIRNSNGTTVNNSTVGLRMNIIQGSAAGTVVYSENFSETTSNIGLVNVVVGQGTPLVGSFGSVNWGSGPYFLEVAVDASGGTNYTVLGTQQMMSVPYALYAENSGTPGPQGPIGAQGPAGPQGANGQDGLSAYQMWLAQGNTGTEADFLSSLTGPQGATGATGPQGPAGPQGIPGSQDAWGLTGNAGTNASTNFIGTTDAQDVVVKSNGVERMRVIEGGPLTVPNAGNNIAVELNGNDNNGSSSAVLKIKSAGQEMLIDGNEIDMNEYAFINYNSGSYTILNGNAGRVGIGEISPLAKLHIKNTTASYDYSTGNGYGDLMIGTSANGAAFGVSTGGAGAGDLMIWTRSATGTRNIRFGSTDGTTGTTNMVINSNGNVGVGTVSPNYRINAVNSNTGSESTPIQIENPNSVNGTSVSIGFSTATSRAQTGAISNILVGGSVRDFSFTLDDGTSMKERLRITGAGNVGIGTSLPTGKLHVNNDVNGSDSSFIVTTAGKVGMGMTPTMRLDVWPSGTITDQQVMRVTGYVLDNPTSPPIAAIRGSADGAAVFEISKSVGGSRNFAQLRMGVDGNLGSIYSNGGNFGININNPARSLHVKDVMRLEPIPTAPSSPAAGDMYFDSTLNKLRVYDGTTWQNCW